MECWTYRSCSDIYLLSNKCDQSDSNPTLRRSINRVKVGMSAGSPADINLPSNPFTQNLKEQIGHPWVEHCLGSTICSDHTLSCTSVLAAASLRRKTDFFCEGLMFLTLTSLPTPTPTVIIKAEQPFLSFSHFSKDQSSFFWSSFCQRNSKSPTDKSTSFQLTA